MKGRIFFLATAQAIRAGVTALIPISSITLFGWASAGSDTGNTGDALRGAGLIWVASHHTLFSVQLQNSVSEAQFWFLPIGLLIVPYLTLRGSGLRIARELHGEPVENLLVASLSLIFSYSVLLISVARIVQNPDIKPHLLTTFFCGVLTSLLFGVPRILRVNWSRRIKEIVLPVRNNLMALLGISTLAVVVSLIFNFQEVINVITVLRLGVISGLFVLVLSLLYLPNVAVWAMAYLSGAGFGFGAGSLVAPWTTNVGSVPAFPIFAAIPAQAPPFATFLPLVVLIIFMIVGFRRFQVLEYSQAFLPGLKVSVIVVAAAFVLAFLSGGPMVGGNLSAVGPSLWKFPLLIGIESLIGVVPGIMGRVLLDRMRPRQRLRRA